MAHHTYFVDPDSPAQRDFVRFHIQDTTPGSGPLPLDANFTDEILDAIIAEEGTWQRAVASCYEALAAAWFKHPSFQADGLSVSQSHTGKNFEEAGNTWRKRYGGQAGSSMHARSMIRVDGWSTDIRTDTVDN